MSDPVTNVEIEDVLSSIRRLVSTDGREDDSRDEDTGAQAEAEQDGADRLVLTPSLRVDNSHPQPSENAAHEAVAEPADMAFDADDDDHDHDQDAEASGDEVEQHHDDDAPQARHAADHWAEDGEQHDGDHDGDHGDDQSHDSGDDEASSEAFDDTDDAGDTPEPGFDGDPAPDFMHTDLTPSADAEPAADPDIPEADARADELHARVAVMEEAVASRDEQWEPDGTTDDAYSGGPVDPLPWEDFQPDATGTVIETEAASDDPAPEEPAPDFGPADTGEVWDVEEAPQAAAYVDMDDMDEGGDRDYIEDAQEDEDDKPRAGVSDTGGVAQDAASLPEDILDEEALRDLVSEIVREELQGALGERITRNVRKLVRREIHRALAIQDLE